MMESLVQDLPIALLMALIGAIVFALIGIISGTDETATIAPLTMIVILFGVPPAGIFAFFLAAIVAKHMTHAVPTFLLGIPGDTLAVPLLDDANRMNALGLPHVALRKAVAGAVISVFVAIPSAVLFSWLLSPIEALIASWAPWIFLVAAVGIAYSSKGKLAAVFCLVPFSALILGINAWSGGFGIKLSTSYFLGIAIGPMILALVSTLVPVVRAKMQQHGPSEVFLAKDPTQTGDNKSKGTFSPFRVLDQTQQKAVVLSSIGTSATFVFSPVAMTVLVGEIVKARIKNSYQRLTTSIAAKNGTTESTYIAEVLIPLIAFGLPLSPVAAGPAAPLFNAPPVFNTDAATGEIQNLSSFLSTEQFLVYGLLAAAIATLIAYPFVMRFAYPAAKFVVQKVSHESIISAFIGLVVLVSLWEGGIVGLVATLTVGLVSGLLIKVIRVHAGVLFMSYYVAVLTVPALISAFV